AVAHRCTGLHSLPQGSPLNELLVEVLVWGRVGNPRFGLVRSARRRLQQPGAGRRYRAGPPGYDPAPSVVQVLPAFPARLVFAMLQALPVPRAHHRELEDVTWLESVALLAPLHLHPRF